MKNTMKKLVTVVLTLAMVFSTFATVETKNVKADDLYNYALDATVTTSSDENASYAGSFANDGDMNTRWSSSFADNQWIQLDFGKTVKIGSVVLYWEAAYAKQYKLSWSQDGDTWYDAVEWGSSNTAYSSETSHMFYNRPVRYIRLTCLKRGTPYGVSLFEFKALGTAGQNEETTTPEPTTEEVTEAPTTAEPTTAEVETETMMVDSGLVCISDLATVTASSTEGAGYEASNVLDHNKNTRWSSAFRDGEYLLFDFGEVCRVNSVVIDWEAAYAQTYKIERSLDGENWSEIQINAPIINLRSENRYYSGYDARYVKITCINRATPYGVSMFEVTMMGTHKIPLSYPKPTAAATTEAATEAPTTTEEVTEAPTTEAVTEAPTTVEETTTEETTLPGPLEVIGAVVSEPKDNTVGVVWGQDAERINSGCKYNVFIDGILRFVNVPCNYYEYQGLNAGKHTVLIQAVLNGQSSKGVEFEIEIKGVKMKRDIAVGATVTGPAMDGYDASYVCDGNADTVWRVQQLYPTLTIDLGEVKDVSGMHLIWLSSYDCPKGVSILTSVDGLSWTNPVNADVPYSSYSGDSTYVELNVSARYFMVCMGGYNNLPHFYGCRQIAIYEQ